MSDLKNMFYLSVCNINDYKVQTPQYIVELSII